MKKALKRELKKEPRIPKMRPMTLRIEPEIYEYFLEQSYKNDRSVSGELIHFIKVHLENLKK